MSKKYIGSLNVADTFVKFSIYDKKASKLTSKCEKIEILHPVPGLEEIDPNKLFTNILDIIKTCMSEKNITASEFICIGITTHRNSFITWNRHTGETYHNLITRKDTRSDDYVKEWNECKELKNFNTNSDFLYKVTSSSQFLAAKYLRFSSQLTLPRLKHCIKHNTRLKDEMKSGDAWYGALDTWLLYKLNKGKNIGHISDYSSCAGMGLFDPFTLQYSGFLLEHFKFKKRSVLPKPVPNSHDFGYIDKSFFGDDIKISCSIANQSASMWADCCFKAGDIKVSMDRDIFLTVNFETDHVNSLEKLYPIVAWQFTEEKPAYGAEVNTNENLSVLSWAAKEGLIIDFNKASEMAESAGDPGSVYFIPTFDSDSQPISDDNYAYEGFIGLNPAVSDAQKIRVILESIAFRTAMLIDYCKEETNYNVRCIRVEGEGFQIDFICQLIADCIGAVIERASDSDMASFGAMTIAGFNEGVWKDKMNLCKLRKINKSFIPRVEMLEYSKIKFEEWKEQVIDYLRLDW